MNEDNGTVDARGIFKHMVASFLVSVGVGVEQRVSVVFQSVKRDANDNGIICLSSLAQVVQ